MAKIQLHEYCRGGLFLLFMISFVTFGFTSAYAQSSTVEITIDAQPRMTSIIIDNVIYLPSQLPVKFSWDENSVHSVVIPAVSSYEGTAKRYDFVQWNDMSPSLSRSIKAEADMPVKNFIAIMETKYLLTVYSDHGSPSGAGWYGEGETAQLVLPSEEQYIEEVPGKVRHVFAGWSDGYKPGSLNNFIDINGPTVVLANWKEQYMLTVASAVTSGSGAGWYDKDALARASVPETVEVAEQGKKYSFREWQVLGDSDRVISDKTHTSTDVIMDGPHTIAPLWNELYYVGVDSNIGNPTGQDYYAKGETATITIDPIYETEPGKVRYILSGWEGARLDAPSHSLEFKVSEPVTLKPVWTKEYYVKINSLYGMAEGSGWYEEGTPATLQIKASSLDTGLGKKVEFAGWSAPGSQPLQASEYHIDSVSSPVEVNVMWKADDSTQLVLIVAALLGVVVTAMLTLNARRKKEVPPSNGPSNNWQVRRRFD